MAILRFLICRLGSIVSLLDCVSAQEMARQNYCAESGEAEEDEAEDGVDKTEEVRADAVRDETNDDG